jgi:hypothetical protein
MINRYQELENDVFAIIREATTDLPIFPANFNVDAPEYIRVTIISSRKGVNVTSIEGQVIFDIFITAGTGPSKLTFIADQLDGYFLGESLRNTQFFESAYTPLGRDRDNPSLYQGQYTLTFKHFRGSNGSY